MTRAARADVAGREDPAGHRDEVGEEVDRDRAGVGVGLEAGVGGDLRELLLDLRDMAVAAEAVRLHALVDLAEHQVGLRLAARARDAALGVDHEVLDQARARERRERQERGGRVAAGRADDGDRRVDERLELGPVELGQAVDRDVEEVGVRVLEAVPARVVGGVAEAEVGPEVDDRGAGLDDPGDDGRGRAVGQGEEDGVDVRERGVDDQAGVGEVRVDAVERVAVAVAALEADDRHVRVAGRGGGSARRRHSRTPRRCRPGCAGRRRCRRPQPSRVASAGRNQTGGPPRPGSPARAPRSRAQHQAPHGERARRSGRGPMDRRHGRMTIQGDA